MPKVVCRLASELRAPEQGVLDGAGRSNVRDIRLVENVVALRGGIVARKADKGSCRIHCPGKHILIELVVSAKQGAVSKIQSCPKLPLDDGRSQVDVGVRRAFVRVAKKCGAVSDGRFPLK